VPDALTLDLSQVNGSPFLTVRGDIDAHSVVELRAVLDGLPADEQVVVDMSGVGFMDSSGLGALLDHSLRVEGTGGSIRIANPSRPVHRVVEITGLSHVFYGPQDECSAGELSIASASMPRRAPSGCGG